jgi:transcriptional regulator with XRE-family HTH domain
MKTCDKLRAQRGKLGLTQKQVAHKLNMSTVQYNGYENARHEPSEKTMDRIARVLKVAADDLWGDEWAVEEDGEKTIEVQKDELRQRVAKEHGWKLDRVRVIIQLD